MPSESDRPIEKQLRAYAERRRAAAGKDAFALHPVTRNAFQVEVEREFGRQARFGGPRRSWLSLWWPRLALGGGALAVVALLAIALVPHGSQEKVGDLVKAESVDKAQMPGPAATVGGKSAGDATLELRKRNEGTGLAADSVPVVGQRQEFQFTARKALPAKPAIEAAQQPATSRVAEPRPAPLSATRQTPRTEASAAERQPEPAVAAAAPAALPLQGDFRVVILNDRISLVDSDQSNYSGLLEPLNPESVGAATPNRSLTFDERYYKFVQNGIEQVVPLAAQFILTGTNRLSRLPVQIVGQMVTRTQAVPVQVAADTAAKQAPAPSAVFLQINATATVNGAAPVQIDATTQPQ